MKSLIRIAGFASALILALTLKSCSDKACYEDMDPVMYTSLLESGTGLEKKADSLRVMGAVSPSPVKMFSQSSVTSFTLPLDPASDVSTFYIILNGITDTAVITYTSHPQLVSAECGYTFNSEITGIKSTHNIIDTLTLENKSVNLYGERNLRLFY